MRTRHAHPMRDVLPNERVTGGVPVHAQERGSQRAGASPRIRSLRRRTLLHPRENKLRGLCGFCVPRTWTGCTTHAAGGRLTLVYAPHDPAQSWRQVGSPFVLTTRDTKDTKRSDPLTPST